MSLNDPSSPNYKKNVGRLVTDRYTFKDHVEGNSERHAASSIDIVPSVVIDGNIKTNMQDAIDTLSTLISAPSIPDASPSTKGILQLIGDLDGLATNVKVTGLQNIPISALTPSDGDVLTFNLSNGDWEPGAPAGGFTASLDLSGNNLAQTVIGIQGNAILAGTPNDGDLLTYVTANNRWEPVAPATTFTAATDLAGTNTSQTVKQITGYVNGFVNAVDILANDFIWEKHLGPHLYVDTIDDSPGSVFRITAQNATGADFDGGDVWISGGAKGTGTALKGGVALFLDNETDIMLQTREVAVGRRVLGLLGGIDSTVMPTGSGDNVIYIADCNDEPDVSTATGKPINGSILFSSGGALQVKQSDGYRFPLGSVNNPFVWKSDNSHFVFTYRTVNTTNNLPAANALVYAISSNTSVLVEATHVGRKNNTTSCVQYKQTHSFTRGTGAAEAVGLISNDYTKYTTGDAEDWTISDIQLSGNNIVVTTGVDATTFDNLNWFSIIKLTIIHY